MHFGKNEVDLTNFDYRLPADTARTERILQGAGTGQSDVFVGAPKWGYKNWTGTVYPKGLKDSEFLKVYAQHFDTVECGATFYVQQPPERIKEWKEMVQHNPAFKFCPKFPQSISHIRRFRNVQEHTDNFYKSIAAFGPHLGPLFLQLPDNFTPNSFSDLKSYLAQLPTDVTLFVEVRNKKWFENEEHRDNFFNLLSSLNIGTVIADTRGRRDCLHMELTTPQAFIRFGNTGDDLIDFKRLDEWAARLKSWKQQGLKSAYFFIHGGDFPTLSLFNYFIPILNRELGINIKLPGGYVV